MIFNLSIREGIFQNILMVQTPVSGNRLFTKKAIVTVLLSHVVT